MDGQAPHSPGYITPYTERRSDPTSLFSQRIDPLLIHSVILLERNGLFQAIPRIARESRQTEIRDQV